MNTLELETSNRKTGVDVHDGHLRMRRLSHHLTLRRYYPNLLGTSYSWP